MNRKTPITAIRKIYADFHTSFLENPVSGDLSLNINEEAVKSSILNLIHTDKGERLFQPNLGCGIRALLFDNIGLDTFITIEEVIKETLQRYEPRANIIAIDVIGSPDLNTVTITIVFNVINSQEDISLSTTITRIR